MSETNDAVTSPVERLVMWCMLPIKIPMLIIVLPLLPFFAAIDYGTSAYDEKRYSEYLIRNFKGLVKFLTT